MTNRELLSTPTELLGPLDRQRRHVLRAELSPMPCPACRRPVDALAAAGTDVDAYCFDADDPAYRCVHCRAVLGRVVPFIAVGPGWHWQLDHTWLADRLRKGEAYEREHPEGVS